MRIAADAWAPGAGRSPTVLVQHRYWRGADMRWPVGRGGPRPGAAATRMLAAGYSVVDMDVRGAGASFGARPDEWPPEEAGDAEAVLDWIVSRPWSDGRVAAVGISYGGTAALLLAARGHSALRAVAARFCFWDLADDLVLPGGVRNTWLGERWAARVAVLDRGRTSRSAGCGRAWPCAVPGRSPATAGGLSEAIAGRGDGPTDHSRSATADRLRAGAPSAAAAAIRDSGVAVHSLGGWYDGAAARAAVEIHRALGGELVLGRVDHGGYHDVSPWNTSGELRFDIGGEVLGFLDRAFERPGAESVAPVRYHVIGAERWRAAPSWPPAKDTTLALHLDAGGALTPGPAADGADDHVLDLSASTGELTRWRGQLQPAPPTAYARDRSARPAYISPPFPDGLEIVGEPACLLRLEAGADRAQVFSYLDEIRPDGSAVYITEGCAAVSWTVAGHRARRAPADRVSDRPAKRASHVARGRRRRGVRASAARGRADPPASRRPGAEPARAARGAPGLSPLKVVRAMPMLSMRRPGNGAPIHTVSWRLHAANRTDTRNPRRGAGSRGVRRLGQRDHPDATGRAAPERGRRPHAPRHDAPAARRSRAQLAARVGGARLVRLVEVRPAPEGRQDHGRQLEEPRGLLRVWHDGADPLRRDRLRVGGRRAEDARRQHEAERHPVRQACSS